ncbi:hypothetical protein GH714_015528 [Hevea brasiliensis]|uniref:Proteasome subunit alpha type n=1 Tax=Hevea brasiliensis TaxID=3981 RepID=A0A6A6NHJ7_HEVBR|nr:hypothetical protein GH714_015528 [Hevea brasiliensis]
MFRNQYDTDVTTWSPAGRLFQVEYAMEAVKQGSAAIGLRSKAHVVLACVNKAIPSFPPTRRRSSRSMTTSALPSPALQPMVAFFHVSYRLTSSGVDVGDHLLELQCPSGNYFEYPAFAIGSRSQAAKTYLERRFENFTDSSREDLIKDALIAVRETLQGETLKSSICTIAVVGIGEAFHTLDQETVQQLIDAFEIVAEPEAPAAEPDAAARR